MQLWLSFEDVDHLLITWQSSSWRRSWQYPYIGRGLSALAVPRVQFRTEIYLPSATIIARTVEQLAQNRVPWGTFIAVVGQGRWISAHSCT